MRVWTVSAGLLQSFVRQYRYFKGIISDHEWRPKNLCEEVELNLIKLGTIRSPTPTSSPIQTLPQAPSH
jgi:hypothetical protein